MISSNMVDIFYINNNDYSKVVNIFNNKEIVIVFDNNTKKYLEVIKPILNTASKVLEVNLGDGVIANESAIEHISSKVTKNVNLIGLGSGTISDLCKYVGTKNDAITTLIPTAPSMDGYLSKGSALIINNAKVTKEVKIPSNIIIINDILITAPRRLISAGYGDIFGKFTSLADWKLSNIVNDEEINDEAFQLMDKALKETVLLAKSSEPFSVSAIEKLIDTLLIAGIAMAKCGNSRPASGSEHHMSHFLEMHYLDDLNAPLHGEKVAVGTLISIKLYEYLNSFKPNQKIVKLIDELPPLNDLKEIYYNIGLKTSFKELGVNDDVVRKMLLNAHLMRDRYTILTYYNNKNSTEEITKYIIKNM